MKRQVVLLGWFLLLIVSCDLLAQDSAQVKVAQIMRQGGIEKSKSSVQFAPDKKIAGVDSINNHPGLNSSAIMQMSFAAEIPLTTAVVLVESDEFTPMEAGVCEVVNGFLADFCFQYPDDANCQF